MMEQQKSPVSAKDPSLAIARRDPSDLLELASVFVRLDHVARIIVNANQSVM